MIERVRIIPEKESVSVDQDGFDRLLRWLDPDREAAARKYEDIRARLIRMFVRRGHYQAEDLADETIDRVIKKLPVIEKDYAGDPALYFFAMARKVAKDRLVETRDNKR